MHFCIFALRVRISNLFNPPYIEKLIARFLPSGAPSHIPAKTLPFSKNFDQHMESALEGSTASDPSYPRLVKGLQLDEVGRERQMQRQGAQRAEALAEGSVELAQAMVPQALALARGGG